MKQGKDRNRKEEGFYILENYPCRDQGEVLLFLHDMSLKGGEHGEVYTCLFDKIFTEIETSVNKVWNFLLTGVSKKI